MEALFDIKVIDTDAPSEQILDTGALEKKLGSG